MAGTNTFYNRSMTDEDLQVFIPDTKMIEESIKEFVEMYSLRKRNNREYWLLDIGYWTANVEDMTSFYDRIRNDLRDLQLDLDDDLYFFVSVEKEKSVYIGEHYSISKSVQTKISYMGSWSLDAGFQMMDTQKWIRRGNLEVRDFKFVLH